jgi:hypothetical protein
VLRLGDSPGAVRSAAGAGHAEYSDSRGVEGEVGALGNTGLSRPSSQIAEGWAHRGRTAVARGQNIRLGDIGVGHEEEGTRDAASGGAVMVEFVKR